MNELKKYKNNYAFIYQNPKRFNMLVSIYIVVLILSISYSFSSKMYSKKVMKGVINNNQIVIPISVLDIEKINKSSYIKVDDKKYSLSNMKFSELYNNGNINMQDIIVRFDNKKYLNNQIVEVTFYYEYDYVIKKIVRGVLG